MKWLFAAAVDRLVDLALVVGIAALLAATLAACAAQVPVLALECEAQGREKFGLWCSRHPPPQSESTPIPEISGPPQHPARQSSKVRF